MPSADVDLRATPNGPWALKSSGKLGFKQHFALPIKSGRQLIVDDDRCRIPIHSGLASCSLPCSWGAPIGDGRPAADISSIERQHAFRPASDNVVFPSTEDQTPGN